MVQTLESLKGGGGYAMVGCTATIGSMVTHELDSLKRSDKMPVASKRKIQIPPVSLPCGSPIMKPSLPRKSLSKDASSSSSASHSTCCPRIPGKTQKAKLHVQRDAYSIPMLASDGIARLTDGIPNGYKPEERAFHIVEVVNIKCGHNYKEQSSSIANRLKKFGFSKLS